MYEMPLEQCRKVFGQMAERGLIKAGSAELAAEEYLGIITMAFDRYVLGNPDVEQGMLGGSQLEEELKRYLINVIFLEDAGHGINHEKAEEVNRLIIEYFSGQIGNLRV